MGPPSRSTTRLDPAIRRAQLVEAAATVYAERAPDAVSLDDVAGAAGVSRSLVYAYFGDRGGLLAEVYLRELEQLDHDLGHPIDTLLPDRIVLRRVARRYLQTARDNERAWRVIAAAGALTHPAVKAARQARADRIAREWGGSAEARVLATAVLAMLEAGVQSWSDRRDLGIERAADLLSSSLWAGLAAVHLPEPV